MDCILTTLSSFTACYYYIVAIVVLVIFYKQLSYLRKKGSIPGPILVVPFIGNAISLVRNPTRFWEVQADLAKTSQDGISANYIFGKFIVFIRSTDLSHKVFTNIRPDAFQFLGHPFGKMLFGEDNIIYKFGQEHKNLRRHIMPNFTRKALATYLSSQQKVILKHLILWVKLSKQSPNKAINLRMLCWDMNLETSQTVFVGPYMNPGSKERFRNNYNLFNVGMLSLPIDLPGFAFKKAKIATDRILETLVSCAKESEKRMNLGIEPTCLVDFYVQEVSSKVHTINNNGGTSTSHKQFPVPSPSNDKSTNAIGGHLFDFLFAAQDASTSSLLWAVALLDSHPEVLEKVRKEVAGIWSPESDTPITGEQLREMKYTEAVAMEIVRLKAPATVIPHIAVKDFLLTGTYMIPKGTMVFPSVYESSFQGFIDPYRFDPERFLGKRQEGRVYDKNFLVFGAGPHRCVGQRYAINHLVLFIAMFTTLLDFKRLRANGCDEFIYVPTICPKDGCNVFLSQRSTCHPTFS